MKTALFYRFYPLKEFNAKQCDKPFNDHDWKVSYNNHFGHGMERITYLIRALYFFLHETGPYDRKSQEKK